MINPIHIRVVKMDKDELKKMSKDERMQYLAAQAISDAVPMKSLPQICREVDSNITHTWVHDIKPPLLERLNPFNDKRSAWMVLCYTGCNCGCQDRVGASHLITGFKKPAIVADMTRLAVLNCCVSPDDLDIKAKLGKIIEHVTGQSGVEVLDFGVGEMPRRLKQNNNTEH